MDTIDISVKLPKSVLSAAKVREKELEGLLRHSLAIELFRKGLISLGKATEIAGTSTKWDTMQLLAKYDVSIDYSAEYAQQDMKTLTEKLKL